MDLVFANEIGRLIEATNLVRRSFLPLFARAGLARIRFHDLRHTAATLLLGKGVHPKIVSEMPLVDRDHARHLLALHPDDAGASRSGDA